MHSSPPQDEKRDIPLKPFTHAETRNRICMRFMYKPAIEYAFLSFGVGWGGWGNNVHVNLNTNGSVICALGWGCGVGWGNNVHAMPWGSPLALAHTSWYAMEIFSGTLLVLSLSGVFFV